jgi:hypothetical protein
MHGKRLLRFAIGASRDRGWGFINFEGDKPSGLAGSLLRL